MLDDLRSMAVFAAVVKEGSFRRAGQQLQLSASVVSHHVARLEKRLNCALLYRTTRKLSLTNDGEAFYQACARAVQAADDGLNQLHQRKDLLTGRLRLGVPALLAQGPFIEDIRAFAMEFPGVELELLFSDERRNQVEDGVDVSIRIGWLADSGLRAKLLFEVERLLCASPALVASSLDGGEVVTPDDLQRLPWIQAGGMPGYVDLIGPDGEARRIACPSKLRVNSGTASRELALVGAGAIEVLEFMVREPLASGQLQRLLPTWRMQSAGVYAVWPSNVTRGALAQRFVDFLSQRLAQATHTKPLSKGLLGFGR